MILSDIRSGVVSCDKNLFPARISVLLSFFFILYFVIAIKIFNVAIFYKQENKNFYKTSSIAKRKDILDRNGNILAVNLSTISIYANPQKILDHNKTIDGLSRVLSGVSRSALSKKIKSDKSFVWIKRNVTPREQKSVNDLGLPGVYYEISEKRAYPYGGLFSHVLGYVGLDGEGLAGIEKQYDKFLRDEQSEYAQLKLTLDAKLQNIARDELSKAIGEFSALGGAAIIQNPKTGEVLAMVSMPDYDPHHPGKADQNAMFNRASLGSYELGSIFKVFTVAMALDQKVTSLTDAYDVSKPIEFKKYTIKDFYGKGGYLSLPEILMYSSNIGTVQIAFELGIDKQYDYLKSFGFLSKLNVDFPEVSNPIYPKYEKMNSISSATISYGYGLSASPLQALRAFNAAVNGGQLVDTYFSFSDVIPDEPKRVIKKSTSEKIRKLLNLVVQKGSGKKARIANYYLGGKSGTANKPVNGKYNGKSRISSFIAAFPIDDPEYTILVMLDEPKGNKKTWGFATGGWTAAPVVGAIVKRIINVENIPPAKSTDIIKKLSLDYETGKEEKYL